MKEGVIRVQAAHIFLNAAHYIRKYGWQEEGMSEDGKPRCSMGALASAYPKERGDSRVAELMYNTLYRELHGLTLTEFNEKYKSGERVAKLFERTATSLL